MDTPTPDLGRRAFLEGGLAAGAGALLAACTPAPAGPQATDIARLDHTPIAGLARPDSTAAVCAAVRGWRGPVCIAGARCSMGGQTRAPGALQLDLAGMDRLLHLDTAARVARVQAGMRWRQLQALLDPHDLAVKVMQSYSNFSIGGSVSVNCHGRYAGNGALAGSVRALQLVDAAGEVHALSREREPELFAAVLGGYGGLGVVTEVELELAENARIARQAQHVPLADYPAWFHDQVQGRPDVILHNADLSPPAFDAPVAVTWRLSQQALTDPRRLLPTGLDYRREQSLIWSAAELPAGARLREHYYTAPLLEQPRVVMRNLEASLDIASLEPRSRRWSTYLLQEYFIPVAQFASFATRMRAILHAASVQALNVSIRHAPADTCTLLRWAPQEVFSFVLYHKQRTTPAAEAATARWTRALVDAALEHGGRHYLPYRLHATAGQVQRGYPQLRAFALLKRQIDPANRFRNLLWGRYLPRP